MFKAAGVDAVTLANASGICKSSCRPNGHAKRVTGCCATTPGMKPSEMPGGNSKWHALIVNEIPIAVNTRQNALRAALEDVPARKWMECCERAVKELGRTEGHDHIRSPRTVQQWHLAFRQNNEAIRNPKFHTHGKVMLPPLLEQNPDLKK
jgi:hypothetical protein